MPGAFIGTSGWSYDAWKDSFYRGVPRRRWLEHASRAFSSLEINGSFYRLPSEEALARWREETPPGFRFAMKAHRFLTHRKRLLGIEEHLPLSKARALPLGEKLAVMLWRLPDTFERDLARLEGLARAVRDWSFCRHAVELRHASWFDDVVAALLEAQGFANVLSNAPDFPLWGRVTTDLVYVRLHGKPYKYASSYSDEELSAWAKRVREWLGQGRDVYLYFDNDAHAHAPRNARSLLGFLAR